jgi:hypothetical protein
MDRILFYVCLPGAALRVAFAIAAFAISFGAFWLIDDIWIALISGSGTWPSWHSLGTSVVVFPVIFFAVGITNSYLDSNALSWNPTPKSSTVYLIPLNWWHAVLRALVSLIMLLQQFAYYGMQLLCLKLVLLGIGFHELAADWRIYILWLFYGILCAHMMHLQRNILFLRLRLLMEKQNIKWHI